MAEHAQLKMDDYFPHSKSLLAMSRYVSELKTSLRESEDSINTCQLKLKDAKDRDLHMKSKLQHLLGYHEFLTRLKLDPSIWMSQEEADNDTSIEISEEYKKEKKKFQELLKEVSAISEAFDMAEEAVQQKDVIQKKMDELETKHQKLEDLIHRSEECPKEFKRQAETKSGADEMIQKKKLEIEEKKKAIVKLEEEIKAQESMLQDNDKVLFAAVENFISENASQNDKLQQDLRLMSRLLGDQI